MGYFVFPVLNVVDEDIDGAAFIDLSEADIKSLVPKLGMVKKIARLQKVNFTRKFSVTVYACMYMPTKNKIALLWLHIKVIM